MGDAHGMQRAFQFALPVIQKPLEGREFRCEIVFLPNVELQKARMIGKVVVNLRGCETVALICSRNSLLTMRLSYRARSGIKSLRASSGPPFLEVTAYLGATIVQSAKCVHDGVKRHRARSTRWLSQRRHGVDGASIRSP
ncbi:hypothetical protein BAE42_00430 [Mesorhizobium loti]|uniref:Uncharacterized protein n=1 Tax=Rhizobium loti TaxID=381 RepID=A0A1A5ILX0_RHILI|nr:hypothetical protein BAE39_29480 [Mesorhizobium loti]OBP80179.1 hypothetical protein BAE42_00430 [Mesorhizobium loti]OBP84479.1 hypothetical protein BAE38_23720 [Mesorhizobium loti]OBP86242.1 hypothetical protein BAE41_26270 [Mesorhizobium loti]OBP88723.1 hypothetical protein BAE40_19515 [Mesorhizobium loti]